MDSARFVFADEVMRRTGGQGVDLVLNSLSGEAIPKGISILAEHGQFIEIGKRDIYQNKNLGMAVSQERLASGSRRNAVRVRSRWPSRSDGCSTSSDRASSLRFLIASSRSRTSGGRFSAWPTPSTWARSWSRYRV